MSSQNRYVFAMHRGGSSIVGILARKIAAMAELDFVGIGAHADSFHETGPDGAAVLTGTAPDGTKVFRPNPENWAGRSGLFAPIRRADFFPAEQLTAADRAVLVVRDPRDCMVSGYYGFLRLHKGGLANPVNQRLYEEGVDSYVMSAMLPMYGRIIRDFAALVRARPEITVLTYEQMVLDFDGWLEAFFRALELDEARLPLAKRQLRHHFAPKEDENEDAHKRQMLPGDHLRKLRPETIEAITEAVAGELEFFGYPLQAAEVS